jgi:hypothetical protein
MTALLKAFDIVPGWVYAALLAMALAGGCVERSMHLNTKMQAAEYKQQVAEKEVLRAAAAAAAERFRHEVNMLRIQRAQEIDDALREDRRMANAAATAALPERDRLRNETAAATASSGQGLRDPSALARAEESARAFGRLLVSCDATAEGLARDAEDLAAQVRALIARYESLLLSPGLDPSPDGGQVHPSSGLRWHDVVHATKPDLAGDARVDLGLRLFGVDPLVLSKGNPPTHHALSDPR